MKTPEEILDEVAVLNMKSVQQMVCTKELVIKAMRLYAKAYYEREIKNSLQEYKEVIKQLLETYVINLNDNGNPKASITDILKLIDKALVLVKETNTERYCECGFGFKLKNFDECAICGGKWKGRKIK